MEEDLIARRGREESALGAIKIKKKTY